MEASVAAGAGQGDGGQAGDGQAADAQGQAGQGLDLGPLQQQLEAVAGGQEQLRQMLLSQQDPGDQAQEPEDPFADTSWMDIDNPTWTPETMAQRLTQGIDHTVSQQVQSVVQPITEGLQTLQDQFQQEQRRQAAMDLVAEFPEMGEQETAQQVVTAARQLAEQYGVQDLAQQPWFWRMTYMAGRAADAAHAEGQAPSAATLESGQGARPGTSQSDLDAMGDSIVSSQRGRSVLPFK